MFPRQRERASQVKTVPGLGREQASRLMRQALLHFYQANCPRAREDPDIGSALDVVYRIDLWSPLQVKGAVAFTLPSFGVGDVNNPERGSPICRNGGPRFPERTPHRREAAGKSSRFSGCFSAMRSVISAGVRLNFPRCCPGARSVSPAGI